MPGLLIRADDDVPCDIVVSARYRTFFLETITNDYHVIIDVIAVKVGFSEWVPALGEVRAASKKRRADMPIQLSMVGSGTLIDIAAKAMERKLYGEYHAPLNSSLDKALEIVRADMAGWSG